MKMMKESLGLVVDVACVIAIVGLVLISSARENPQHHHGDDHHHGRVMMAARDDEGGKIGRPCEEIYVVGEGETLHTISDKCGDPYIVERNPHIHDPDDVFPGLVIKITPCKLFY